MNESIDRQALAARIERLQKREGWTDAATYMALGISGGTLLKLRNQPESSVRASSIRKAMAALERIAPEESTEPAHAAPARRVARMDLSHLDDDALLAEVRRRMRTQSPR